MNPRIALVAALSANNVIGKNGSLPWHLPADMRHFRAMTSGHLVIMGRKTYESIGKPLPNRRNVVLSRSSEYSEKIEVCRTVEEALQKSIGCREVMVIGGSQIYETFLPLADKMYLTHVQTDIEGEHLTLFPKFNPEEWLRVRAWERKADEKNPFAMTFAEYLRKTT